MLKPSGLVSFIRYNVAALAATAADFSTFFLLVSLADFSPVAATPIGSAAGAAIAFALGRNWTFKAKEERKATQALKYALVALGSVVLNTGFVYLLHDLSNLDYKLARILAAGIAALAYNYPLSKYFTFKPYKPY